MSNHQGEYLRSLRISRGVKQCELPDMFGHTGQQFFSNVERGVAKLPWKYVIPLMEKLGGDVSMMRRAIILDFTEQLDSIIGRIN